MKSSAAMNISNDYRSNLANQYDVVVIGGGIYGATMAWETTSRGLKTLLVERNDFGAQTSANSLKIIHGGFRYLQDLDLKRLRESAKEQATLQYIAPHLVKPLECIMPTYRGLTRNRFVMQSGVMVYQLFSFNCNSRLADWQHLPRGGTMSLQKLTERLPSLHDKRVTGAARWYDAQAFNTERLVLSFVMSAARFGAHVRNYTEAVELLSKQGQVAGIRLRDQLTSELHEIETKIIIDCTGPWQLTKEWYGPVELHEVMPRQQVRAWNVIVCRPLAHMAVGFRVPDGGDQTHGSGRLLFAAPWREGTIIGTWYDDTKLGEGSPSAQEISHCLDEVNKAFPGANFGIDDVTRVHTGWLPGVSGADSRFEPVLQKQTRVEQAQNHGGPEGLIFVQGIKYTTARAVAESVVSKLASCCKMQHLKPSISANTRLYGAAFDDFQAYSQFIYRKYQDRFPTNTLRHLLQNYGSLTDKILTYADKQPELANLIPGQDVAICAEVEFVINNEFTCHLSDLILRRTDLGSLKCPTEPVIEYCADRLGEARGWKTEERARNIAELLTAYTAW